MESERSRAPGHRRSSSDAPSSPDPGRDSRPLFGNQMRSALELIAELRKRRAGERPVKEPEFGRLFGNQIRFALSVLAAGRDRRRMR
jgi:hypothetical protein